MRKAVLLSVLLLSAIWAVSAEAQTRGKPLNLKLSVVSDSDSQPVAGAACLLTDYGIFAVTDAEGSRDVGP